jgi:PAS domain S-box-containing protein
MTVPRRSSISFYRAVVVAIVALGILASVITYRARRIKENERAEATFAHRAALRHVLIREIFGHYEDALFGLSALFTRNEPVTHDEFVRATSRLDGRMAGIQAFEWVPLVAHDARAGIEREQPRMGTGGFEFAEFAPDGSRQRARDRVDYYPILYVHPLRGNEAALGYDLKVGKTREILERARETRQILMTPQLRLVQEKENESGVVMVLPVFGAPRLAAGGSASEPMSGETFAGFLQCVFRVNDLLETAHSRQPDTILDMLFVDMSESDPARRTLYYRPAQMASRVTSATETDFRQGMSREFQLPLGQRDWRVLFRPAAGWIEQQSTVMPLVWSGGLLTLSGLLAGLVHSIGRRTETIRAEVAERTAELADSRRQLANMLHALPGMSYRCTYEGQLTVLFVSEGARQLTGWTAEEFVAGTVHFRDCIHPADLDRVREATRKALQEHVDVEVEYRMRTKTGEEKWVLSRGRGVYDTGGTLSVFEGLAIDVTAQKCAESARLELERKLLEGQKLESLGLLAGGIAHDFNNLLSSTLGNASMARMTLGPGNAVDVQLGAIEAASLRAAELCRQMLAYAGKGRFVTEATELSTLTEEMLPLLKISIAHQATLSLELEPALPPVLADAAQIRQIVMNLVVNAADAIGDRGGVITLTTGTMYADRDLLAACVAGAELPPGDFVFLEVRDNGSGMTPEVMAKMFDPFFTTKFAGRGLGLAAVLGIVRGHQGALRVESTPGTGSTFRLLMPPMSVPAPKVKRSDAVRVAAKETSGNVLVIDDEDEVRAVLIAMLKVCGFNATGAADGNAGIAAVRENPSAFDVVVLDLLMPGLNGEQAFRALRALKSDIRILVVSGYTEGDILSRMGGGQELGFLAKPFTRAALDRKLREMLA